MSLDFPPLPAVLGLIDVGTAKIVCLLLVKQSLGDYTVVGVGHQISHGMKAGQVFDAEALEDAVRATVAQAERMAATAVTDIVLAAACGRMSSVHSVAALELSGRAATAADVDRLLAAGRANAELNDRAVLHINAVSATFDGETTSVPPMGRPGQALSIDINAVTGNRAALRQLLHVAERCQLQVQALVPAPLACALAVTTEAERQRGALIIDFGAGTTGLTLFKAGILVAVHVLPVGASHLSFDIMRSLKTTLEEAERIKKNCAIVHSAHPMPADDNATIGDRARRDDHAFMTQVTGADISTILTSRISALLRQIQQWLDLIGVPARQCGEAVLAGNGSRLGGLAPFVESVLGLPARLAVPQPCKALPSALLHPAFATAAGLEVYTREPRWGLRFQSTQPALAPAASWARAAL